MLVLVVKVKSFLLVVPDQTLQISKTPHEIKENQDQVGYLQQYYKDIVDLALKTRLRFGVTTILLSSETPHVTSKFAFTATAAKATIK